MTLSLWIITQNILCVSETVGLMDTMMMLSRGIKSHLSLSVLNLITSSPLSYASPVSVPSLGVCPVPVPSAVCPRDHIN